MPDPVAVKRMFGRIARRYDFANRLLSGGADVWWRNRLVAAVRRRAPADVLDLATGSGDVALALARGLGERVAITGMDFCIPMLDEANKKLAIAGHYPLVQFKSGDGMSLPLEDAQFDAVTISFGLRNMADRHRSLSEMRRVLRPGGALFVLEFSQPHRWFAPLYFFYLRRILPTLASWATGDKGAYDYLCGSIQEFPGHEGISAEILAAGFKSVIAKRMTFGIVALHEGFREA
ncbi:MAG TPA: ubiquinone/menaquinone biosynthesis methyltransferase [Opitutaceae bacterium]